MIAFGSFASSRSAGDAGSVAVVGDVLPDTPLRVTACCSGFGGLATCFGASTVTLGSELAVRPEGVPVCDIAVPLRPHINSAIDMLATARLDEDLMAMSSNAGAATSSLSTQGTTF